MQLYTTFDITKATGLAPTVIYRLVRQLNIPTHNYGQSKLLFDSETANKFIQLANVQPYLTKRGIKQFYNGKLTLTVGTTFYCIAGSYTRHQLNKEVTQ